MNNLNIRPSQKDSKLGLLPLIKELLFVYILVFSILAPSSTWKAEFGDGREYILQTQSIVLDHSLSINPYRRGNYFNETNPFGINLKTKPRDYEDEGRDKTNRAGNNAIEESDQYGGGFGGLYKTLDSTEEGPRYQFIHSWIYSVAVAPIYISTKFIADFYRYLGGVALAVLAGITIFFILLKSAKKILSYAGLMATGSEKPEDLRYSTNFSFEAVSLTIAGIILKLTFSGGEIAYFFEYQAFYIANLIFFSIALSLIWRLSKSWLNLLFIATLCFSPIVPHIKWAHSEIFCFASVILGLGLIQVNKWRSVSPVFLGIGAAQNIPIILMLPLHLILTLEILGSPGMSLKDGLKRMPRQLIFSYLTAILLPILIALQSYYNFGHWNLISSLNQANLNNITLARVKSVLISPQIGALLYFPAAWVAVFLGLLSGRLRMVAATAITALAVIILSSTTANINSAQLSATRYSIWTLAPLYLVPFLSLFRQPAIRRWQIVPIALSFLLVLVIGAWLKSFNFMVGNVTTLFSQNRARPEIAALYRWTELEDDIEPLVENLQRAELRQPYSFSRLYIWNLGKNRSLWIISKRYFKRGENFSLGFKDTLSLEDNPELSKLFQISLLENGTVRFTPKRSMKGRSKGLRRSKNNAELSGIEEVRWSSNPYWGSYRILWISGEVSIVDKSEHVIVREADGEPL